MERDELLMNPNLLVQHLEKPASEFTKADIIKFVEDHAIEMINFRYVGGDGRLKALNFYIRSKAHLDSILSTGERVDGSSLFSYVESGSSDLYVIPKYRTAFYNPFTEIPTLDILCSYYDKDGNRLASSPENIMIKALEELYKNTGYKMDVMGELEYYIISDETEIYKATDQKGYHETSPFAKWGEFRAEAMQAISQAGGVIKYGHSEVGNFTLDGKTYEQNEIEFTTTNMEEAAEQLIIAKWMIRMLGYKYGVNVSFAPKIIAGKAGSGLHIHMKLTKDGKTATVENGQLSDAAKKAIAGILDIAPSLSAFGNTIPTSFLRLVPHQEAPTNICWGDRNRSVLIRVPLGWLGNCNMVTDANPKECPCKNDFSEKQTFEFRCPDGSADIYLLLAGLAVGARHGLEMKNSLEMAKELYVNVNIFKDEHKHIQEKLKKLPLSCWEAAESLLKQGEVYKKYGVFSDGVLEQVANNLKKHNDNGLSEKLYGNNTEILKLVEKHLHCC
ncbi:MAG: glutamine synthetase [Bacteroidetes bacterium GWE2_29_8]|nr:MAG: glutamine synthetase [Bacteroidetes bacterium GWE2_29_8]OFY20639.1 MAG: glutamine synthetase [Bacteroidetes bacterium GWF2_29_10]